MTGDSATLAVIEALDRVGVPYMLVGSFSSNAYGVVRATKDADIVVAWEGRSVSAVMKELGPEFRLDPQMQFESVTGTIRSIIDVESIPFRVELFRLSGDPHDLIRFERRKRVLHAGFGRQIFIPTPEDVIITKLRGRLEPLGERTAMTFATSSRYSATTPLTGNTSIAGPKSTERGKFWTKSAHQFRRSDVRRFCSQASNPPK